MFMISNFNVWWSTKYKWISFQKSCYLWMLLWALKRNLYFNFQILQLFKFKKASIQKNWRNTKKITRKRRELFVAKKRDKSLVKVVPIHYEGCERLSLPSVLQCLLTSFQQIKLVYPCEQAFFFIFCDRWDNQNTFCFVFSAPSSESAF